MFELKDTNELLSGNELRVIMFPDAKLGYYTDRAIECFELPHILVDGEKFWGKSRTVCPCDFYPGLESTGWDLTLPGSYIYNNFADICITSSYLSGMMRIYPAMKYERIEFRSFQTHEVVWDSEEPDKLGEFEDALEQGRVGKIAMLDETDLWNIHTIDISQYFPDKRLFILCTEKDGYPICLRKMSSFDSLAEIIVKTKSTKFVLGHQFFSSYFKFFNNGTYTKPLDSDSARPLPMDPTWGPRFGYKRLKVFARILDLSNQT